MPHKVLSPGARSKEVLVAKKLIISHLRKLKKTAAAAKINEANPVYGPNAVAGVKAIQTVFKLTADGVIGPKTWAVLESAAAYPAPPKKVKNPGVQYDGRRKGHTHGPSNPKVITLHSTESHDYAGIKDLTGVLNYLARTPDQLNVHLVIDKDGNTGQGANFDKMCYHCKGGNTNSIGIEQVGYSRFGFVGWYRRQRQLHKLAKWIAFLSKTYNIPIVHSTTHGVCMHKDIPAGGHSDPGAGYPFKRVLALAIAYKKTGW